MVINPAIESHKVDWCMKFKKPLGGGQFQVPVSVFITYSFYI